MSDTNHLAKIGKPEDLRALPREQLPEVAAELRQEIVERVSRTGGHLASSLGAVELITAIHYVFDTPRDRLVLDVGHQGYPHKMLTGRRECFDQIGKEGGIAKFLRRSKSEYDHFGAGSPSSCAARSPSTTTSAPAMRELRSPPPSAWRGRWSTGASSAAPLR